MDYDIFVFLPTDTTSMACIEESLLLCCHRNLGAFLHGHGRLSENLCCKERNVVKRILKNLFHSRRTHSADVNISIESVNAGGEPPPEA
jgi:hypothetical protein